LFSHLYEEAEQYLVAAVLRPGNAPGSAGAIGILRRLIARVSDAFPRQESGCDSTAASRPRKFGFFWIAKPKVEYLVNMAANAV